MSALAELWKSQLAEHAATGGLAPEWLNALRHAGSAAIEKHGLPHRKVEDWKYTSLKLLEGRSQRLADTEIAYVGEWPAPLSAPEVPVLRLGNGSIGNDFTAPAGTAILPLMDAVQSEPHREWIRQSLESLEVNGAAHAFSALNNSTLNHGLVLHVPEGSDAGHVLLQWAFDEAPPALLYNSRVLIRLEAGASLTLLEQFESAVVHAKGLNLVIQVQLEEGASLHHVRLQQESEDAALIDRVECTVGKDARYFLTTCDWGGGLVRHDTRVALDAPGAEADVNGAFLVAGSRHLDHHVYIDHATGPSRSGQFFRGVLGGRGRGVFNGKARIQPGADGSRVRQSNANLLLSPLAEIDTKPELEIYADEVEASHGATVGQLDEDAVFYLRSRGLNELDARAMLTGAFCKAVLDRAENRPDWLHQALAGRLEKALNDVVGEAE